MEDNYEYNGCLEALEKAMYAKLQEFIASDKLKEAEQMIALMREVGIV